MINRTESLSPDARIETIQRSLRCFQFGIASMVPMIVMPVALLMMFRGDSVTCLIGCVLSGVICAISLLLSLMAASHYNKIRRISKGYWNPARSYRIAGELMSSLGVLLSLILLLLLICVAGGIFP